MTTTKVATAEIASKNSVKKDSVETDSVKIINKKNKKFVNPFNEKDPIQQKFIKCIMKNGKKTMAQKILKDCFKEMNSRGEKDVLKTFEEAFSNVVPNMEVRPKRIGGSVYQIPIEVTVKRQISLPIRWILKGARSKKGQPMYKRLASELIDASNQQGFAFGKKEEVQRVAQANKAFAHLARY
jgi:small subunit ribosomal protein S7